MNFRITRVTILIVALVVVLMMMPANQATLAKSSDAGSYALNPPAPVNYGPDAVPIGKISRVAGPDATSTTHYDWRQFGFDSQHSGNDTLETMISASNVVSLTKRFKVTLPGVADGSPAYLSQVTTPGGVQDLLFLSTTAGHIMAVNAHNGALVWMHQYPAGSCTFGNPPVPCFSTSAPAVDPNRQYVYAYGLDGYIHKYQVGDGTEIIGNGWPEPTTAKNFEKVSTSLSIATAKNGASYLYVGHSGKDDYGDYQGHLTTINLTNGSQHVFNALCSNQVDVYFVLAPGTPDCPATQSGIWARAGAVYLPDNDKIFVTTGNGNFSATQFDWGYSVLELNPDGTGSGNGLPVDSYTYPNWQNLDDHDPGSTSIGILPTPSNSNVKHLAVQGGKSNTMLRLLNLDNLSGQGGPGYLGGEISIFPFPPGGEILTAPAVWVNPADGTTWCYYANNFGMTGFQLTIDSSGTPSLQARWTLTTGGTSPIVANNILYVATKKLIRALDPLTGNQLWSSTLVGNMHLESPIVANGMLYITDQGKHLTAFKPQ